jgi:hypothetical protein
MSKHKHQVLKGNRVFLFLSKHIFSTSSLALGSYPITTQTPGRGLAAVAAQVGPLTSRKMIYSNTFDF